MYSLPFVPPLHYRKEGNTPILMVSYFQVITDKVFSKYQSCGITARTDLIISKDLRDANPLTCNGETFTSGYVLENWVTLDMNKN